MAAYGAFLSAPISHFFVGFFQKMFAGRTGAAARLGQILAMMSIQVRRSGVSFRLERELLIKFVYHMCLDSCGCGRIRILDGCHQRCPITQYRNQDPPDGSSQRSEGEHWPGSRTCLFKQRLTAPLPFAVDVDQLASRYRLRSDFLAR